MQFILVTEVMPPSWETLTFGEQGTNTEHAPHLEESAYQRGSGQEFAVSEVAVRRPLRTSWFFLTHPHPPLWLSSLTALG